MGLQRIRFQSRSGSITLDVSADVSHVDEHGPGSSLLYVTEVERLIAMHIFTGFQDVLHEGERGAGSPLPYGVSGGGRLFPARAQLQDQKSRRSGQLRDC
jgi:hypothetical protein